MQNVLRQAAETWKISQSLFYFFQQRRGNTGYLDQNTMNNQLLNHEDIQIAGIKFTAGMYS